MDRDSLHRRMQSMARKAATESVCPRLCIQRSVRLANVCSPRKDKLLTNLWANSTCRLYLLRFLLKILNHQIIILSRICISWQNSRSCWFRSWITSMTFLPLMEAVLHFIILSCPIFILLQKNTYNNREMSIWMTYLYLRECFTFNFEGFWEINSFFS